MFVTQKTEKFNLTQNNTTCNASLNVLITYRMKDESNNFNRVS